MIETKGKSINNKTNQSIFLKVGLSCIANLPTTNTAKGKR
jgi:hypothetical protein